MAEDGVIGNINSEVLIVEEDDEAEEPLVLFSIESKVNGNDVINLFNPYNSSLCLYSRRMFCLKMLLD